MAAIVSLIDANSAEFAANRADMIKAVAGVREIEGKVKAKEESRRARFEKRGQILPRDRVTLLLDRGSPFLEISTLCGYKMWGDTDGSLAGGNSIIGIGYVNGVRCLINANNSAIKAGTMTPMGVQKSIRGFEIAYQQKLPVVSLIESGGADLTQQMEVFIPAGKMFYLESKLSAAGIPHVSVVHGSSTAGGAYMPGLSDYVIMVRKQAKVFLAGPPLLKAATGEIATDEELGGAEMHAQIAGTAELLAESDGDGIRQARDVVGALGWNKSVPAAPGYQEPLYSAEEIAGVVPTDYRQPYDCREVIARLVDGSEFIEFKSEYDKQTICGRAHIHGKTVGIISNNGPITAAGATKAGQFIQQCDQTGTPLVFLQNTTGYMVGTSSEQAGIVKHGSKMVQAVSNARVPRITIVMGGSFGAGNYGMCGRAFEPDFIFAWPNSRLAVMGGEQAGQVLAMVEESKLKAQGKEAPQEMLDEIVDRIKTKFDAESSALAVTARLIDDGLIDPRDTRKVLGMCLSICQDARQRDLNPNVFGVARL
jgi:geranyl-CoA carboxylase beta subunit